MSQLKHFDLHLLSFNTLYSKVTIKNVLNIYRPQRKVLYSKVSGSYSFHMGWGEGGLPMEGLPTEEVQLTRDLPTWGFVC